MLRTALIQRIFISVFAFLIFTFSISIIHAGEDSDFRTAQMFYMQDEFQLAEAKFSEFLKKWPKSTFGEEAQLLQAECWYRLAEGNSKTTKESLQKAAAAFEKFLTDRPKAKRRPDALVRAVMTRHRLKDYKKSLAHADVFLKENLGLLGTSNAYEGLESQAGDVLYWAGDSSYWLQKPDEAKNHWTNLLLKLPKLPVTADASEGLGWLAFEEKKFGEAVKHFTRASDTEKFAKAAECRVMLARSLAGEKKITEAITALDSVAKLPNGDNQASHVLYYRAEILTNASQWKTALPALLALAKENSGRLRTPVLLRRAAHLQWKASQFDNAVQLADAVLKTTHPEKEKTEEDISAHWVQRSMAGRIKAQALEAKKDLPKALTAALEGLKAAEAIPQSKNKKITAERNAELAACLLLTGELSGGKGEVHFHRILKNHSSSTEAYYAKLRLATLKGNEKKSAEGVKLINELLTSLTAIAKEKNEDFPAEEQNALLLDALFTGSDLTFSQNKFKSTEDYLRRFIKKTPEKDGRILEIKRKLAWCLFKSEDKTKRNEVLTLLPNLLKSTELKPQAAKELLYIQAMSLLQTGKMDKAILALQDLSNKHIDSIYGQEAAYHLSVALFDAGTQKEALPWLNKLLTQLKTTADENPIKTQALKLRSQILLMTGEAGKALADAELLLQQPGIKKEKADSDAVRSAKLLKAMALRDMTNKEKEAVEALNDLLSTLKDSAKPTNEILLEGLRQRGLLLSKQKQFSPAAKDLKQFLGSIAEDAAFPDSKSTTIQPLWEATLRLAYCLEELKETKQAKGLLDKLVKQPLTGTLAFDAFDRQGRLAFTEKNYEKAAASFDKALAVAEGKDLTGKINPTVLAPTWLNNAWSKKLLKQSKEAEAAFGKVVAIDPKGQYADQARLEQGRLQAETGNVESAFAVWAEILKGGPEKKEYKPALIETAVTKAKEERWEDAEAGFASYLEKFPPKEDSASDEAYRKVWCGLGECRLRLGGEKAKTADETFKLALQQYDKTGVVDEIGARALLGLAESALNQDKAFQCKKHALIVKFNRTDSPYLDQALYFSAVASEQLSEPQKAIAYYRELLKKCPESIRANHAKKQLKALGAPVDSPAPKDKKDESGKKEGASENRRKL